MIFAREIDDKSHVIDEAASVSNSYAPIPKKRQRTIRLEPVDRNGCGGSGDVVDDNTPLALLCPICRKRFVSLELLEAHKFKSHTKQRSAPKRIFECAHCIDMCITRSEIIHHLKFKHEEEVYLDQNQRIEFTCEVCDKMFSTKKRYLAHRLQHDKGELECEHCLKKFRLERDLARHEKTHFARAYNCNDCDYETTILQNLRTHVANHMDKPVVTYDCSECDKKYRYPKDLQDHINVHSGEKPYTCKLCSERFSVRHQLNTHNRSRHQRNSQRGRKKPNTKCNICGRVLATTRSLLRHQESHNPIKQHLCDFCGKRLSSAEHLKKHRRIHTGERPYACHFCSKAFSDSENLKMHIRIHTGEKPFKCEVCLKAFSQRSTLTIHRRIHTGERPYVCPLCNKGFVCSGNLTAHRKASCLKTT